MARVVRLEGDRIHDWPSFHDAFCAAFGFPSFYGRNMDAWIDCMSYLDDPSAGMSAVHVETGQQLCLVVRDAASLKLRCPEQFQALVECAAFVNWRLVERGMPPVLTLAFSA